MKSITKCLKCGFIIREGTEASHKCGIPNKIKVPKKVMKDFEDFLEICLNDPQYVSMAESIAISHSFDLGKQHLFAELKIKDLNRNKNKKKPNMKDWDKPKVGMTVLEKGEKKWKRAKRKKR